MIAKTISATVLGVEAHPIEFEGVLAYGLTQFTIVGLPDGTIRERHGPSAGPHPLPFPARLASPKWTSARRLT